jgi:OOP family OmpA-OmpF porin
VIADRMIGQRIKALAGIATSAFLLGALCVPLIALPSAAADSDLYVEYSGGASFVPDQRLIGKDLSGRNLSGQAETDTGFNVGGAFGKRFHEHFRAELQLTYRQNEVENFSLQNEPDNARGHSYMGLLAVMTNGYVDWDLGIGVIPYVGAGIGWGLLEIDAKNAQGDLKSKIEGEDSVFVWSLMLGGSYPINEVLDISLGYRYIATTDGDINARTTSPLPENNGSRRIEAEYDAHEAVLGLRFNF